MAKDYNKMPNNLDAEQALLGCLLIDNELQSELLDTLSEEDFYQDSHKYIYQAMRKAFIGRKPVDLVTLSDTLDKAGELERAGGIAYLTNLAQITPSAANYRYYYDIVKRDSTNRRLIRAAEKIIQNCHESEDENASVAYAEKVVYDISQTEDKSGLLNMSEGNVVGSVLQKFEQIAADKNAFRGTPTGITRLDRVTNGLQKSDLIVIAARPGMGKTSLSMNFVENAALKYGCTCAVFSLEMPRQQIVQRLLCSYANVSMGKALSGTLSDMEWKKLSRASEAVSKAKIYIDDSSRTTPAEVLSKCRRLKAMTGALDLVMIDYIQLMESGERHGGETNRQQEISSITRNLKIMAKELNVPILALSQLRRIQTKEPQLSDLRESGAIEQDADIVMFINRPDVGATEEELATGKVKKGDAEIIIAKHRNGSCDRIKLRFKGECTKFVNIEEKDEYQEPGYQKPDPEEYRIKEEDIPFDTESEPPPFDDEDPYGM
ncbi:MAG: replicative DNA helicase [Clostridia bacterium]|nr:replicative DNA helicase [Clostridia bacterium]